MKRLFASVALILAACGAAMGNGTIVAANADPAGSSTQDDTFFRLLTTRDDDDGFAITNVTDPALIRAQGLMVCRKTTAAIAPGIKITASPV